MSFANPGDQGAKKPPVANAATAISSAQGGTRPTAAATPARNAVAVVSEQEQAEKDRQLLEEKQRLESAQSAEGVKPLSPEDMAIQQKLEPAKPDASSLVKEREVETQPPPALWLATPPPGATGQVAGAEAVKPLSPEEIEAQAIQQKLEALAIDQKLMEEYSGQAGESMSPEAVGSAITAEGVVELPNVGGGGAPSEGAPRNTAPGVKLSQVYGNGGNSQAPTTNDYIELYNSGSPQLLTGWSVQYAASTGTTWTVTALPAITLGTGQYLLVQEAIGTSVVAGQAPGLPTPDATGTIAMSGTDLKVALVSSITALVGGVPTYTGNPTLVDFIGAGTAANWNDTAAAGGGFLAANNAPSHSSALALYRLECGARDTDNSRNDWAVGFPAARNTATALNNGITVIGTALPLTVEETQTARLTATPYRCATNDLGAGTTVTINTTAIGGGAAVPMLDNGVAPDEVASDGIYTVLVTVAAATPVGTKSLPVTVSDGGGLSGGSYIGIQVMPTTTPDNDNCYGAQAVAVPSSTSGTFTGATVESNSMSGYSASMGYKRGLWYTVVGTGNTITASLCATTPSLDSVMMVMCGSCDGLTVIGSNDTSPLTPCTSGAASVAWCSALGTTYYVWISPYSSSASTAAFTLDITQAAACTTAFPCTMCLGTPGPFTETEPGYGIATNDGCGSTPTLFTNIASPGAAPSVIRGTARGMFGNRDVDSYRFQATSSGILTMTIDTLGTQAQAQLYSLAAGGLCPQVSVVNTPLYVARCVSTIQTATGSVTAGNWYAIQVVGGIGIDVAGLSTVFGGQMPGGTTYQYVLTTFITPAGACCKVDGFCSILTAAGCAAIPGAIYQGDNIPCTPTLCPPAGACCMYDGTCVGFQTELYCTSLGGTWQGAGTACGGPYAPGPGGAWQDISTTGTEIVTLLLPTADDGGCTLPIGFTFNFYGLPYTNVWVISNGRLDVGATAYTSGYMPTSIPSTVVPQNVIAALWKDLNCTGKSVRWQLFGTAPSRYLIVQYTGVITYGGTDVNTFQTVLFEGSDCIELRYFAVGAGAGTYKAGIENSTGTVGTDVTARVAAGASIRLCPTTLTCPVNGACCHIDDTCTEGLQSACIATGDVFQGAGTHCTPGLCNAPVGACCFANGSCTQLKQFLCTSQGGTSWLVGVLCDPNPCPQPDIACCYPDASCVMQTAAACTLAGGNPGAFGSTCTPNTCPLPGNACGNPLVVALPPVVWPYVDTNWTCGRLDDYNNTCLGYYDGGEDILYKLVVAQDMCVDMVLSTTTTYTGMSVDDSCPGDVTTCLYKATNSGAGGVTISNVQLLASVGTYYVMIDTWPSPTCIPSFTLTISPCPTGACCIPSTGSCSVISPTACTAAGGVYQGLDVPCDPNPCPQPCTLNCEPTDLVEPEACGLDTNGGCNSAPLYPMTPILLGDTYCGTAWANASLRDTDWYSITLTAATELTWTVTSEFPSALFIMGGTCGGTLTTYASAYGGNCSPVSATACVPHGTYYLFVATGTSAGAVYNGWPCGTSNDYRATLTGVPCEASYCASAATSTADETIDNFTLVGETTINNTTAGCDLYDDFTGISADVMRGAIYSLSITIGDCEGASCYSKWAVVYVDWNGDKDFTEADEMVWASGQLTSTPCPTMVVTGNITVPVTANLGATRMRVIVKEGTSATAPPSCGTYTWGATEDYSLSILAAPAYSVAPGVDCWTTLCDGKTKYGFAATPLPPGFFGPGSDPFAGTVTLGGAGGGPFGTDTSVQRLGTLNFPTAPSSDTVPIQLVALSLVSCQPITVTYNGGQNPEQWNVSVGLSQVIPPPGLMTVTMATPSGGTFGAQFHVQPLFTFTRIAPPGLVTLDTGTAIPPIPPMLMTSSGVPWRTTSPYPACSPDFFPGMLTQGGVPCCVETCHEGPSPDHPHCVWPPECTVHCIGACCFADGTCQEIETAAACVLLGGTFGGIGTNCTPNLCAQPGMDCINPVVVGIPGALPYTNVNTTCGMVNDYANTCLGYYDGGEDTLYKLVVTQDMCVQAVLSTTSTYTGMSIDDSCPGDVTTCLYMATNSGAGGVTLNNVMLYASVGTYYLMIDTWPSPTCIPSYTLTLTACPTGACCVGATCTIESPAACTTLGGLYFGDGTTCVPDPCPTRACCLLSGCQNLSEADCTTAGGTWHSTQTCGSFICNDDCAGATPVGDVTNLAFNTTTATPDGAGTCMTSNNLWYCYTATCTGDATFSLCGSLFDTKLAIYAGCSCPPGAYLACNDDSGPACSGLQSSIKWPVIQGNQYLVEVGGYSTNSGAGVLTISCAAWPQGACCLGTTCYLDYQPTCVTAGGTYGGNNTVCSLLDCNTNGVDDLCDVLSHTSPDCNHNTIPDSCDITSGYSHDWDSNGVPDECQADCQPNGWPDFCDLPGGCALGGCSADPDCGLSLDCQPDGVPDECQLGGKSRVCDQTVYNAGECDGINGTSPAAGWDDNGIVDKFVVPQGGGPLTFQCLHMVILGGAAYTNPPELRLRVYALPTGSIVTDLPSFSAAASIFDYTYTSAGGELVITTHATCYPGAPAYSFDASGPSYTLSAGSYAVFVNFPGYTTASAVYWASAADEGMGVGYIWGVDVNAPYDAAMALAWNLTGGGGGGGADCNTNGIPDDCDIRDCMPLHPEWCDCNTNGIPDSCEIAADPTKDCNNNGILDVCDVPPIGTMPDCNGNLKPDVCDVPPLGTGPDCQPDGIPDVCQLVGNDCQPNGIPDECDIALGGSDDCQLDGIPDECQLGSGGGALLINEGFEDILTLPGWYMQNNSNPLGTTNWFQGNTTVFSAQAGSATSYIGANYNNTTTGTISNWLVTPEVSLINGVVLDFYTRGPTGTIPGTDCWADRMQVRMSLSGSSTNVGPVGDANAVGDFTTLLVDINPTLAACGYPQLWSPDGHYTITITGVPTATQGRLAFRYFVTDGGGGANSNYIGIDTVTLTGDPGIPSNDQNQNGIPDDCECFTCLGDVNDDGNRDGLDVQFFVNCLLGTGTNCGCADMNGVGYVTIDDIGPFVTALITNTGPCP